MKRQHGFWSYIFLLGYLACILVLVVEASMDGATSASQSNAVGGTIAEFFNDVQGDQTVAVSPTSLEIKNKIDKGYVGEKYLLQVETLPNDTTYKANKFSSSNNEVASINGEGLISFLTPGTTTIEVVNEKYQDIKDSFSIEVFNIEANSINSTIDNLDKDENSVYTLYLTKEYHIQTSFEPINTTDKSLTYDYDSSYLEVSVEGNIIPKKSTNGDIINITVKHKELTSTLKVKIDYENIVMLDSINITVPNNEIYVQQTLTPAIIINPTNATFKDYTLSSSDSSILKVNNNKTIVGLKEGNATLTIKSNKYEDITKSITIKVLAQPNISDFTISNATIYIGDTTKVNYKKIPTYAKNPTSIIYTSKNPTIASVNSNGTVTGLQKGTAEIEVNINGITKSCTINVKEKVIDSNIDFTLSAPQTMNYGKVYNINDVIKVQQWIPSKPSNTNFTYELKDTTHGVISDNTITFNKLGVHEVFVTHISSGVSKIVNLECTKYNYDILDSNNNLLTTTNLIVNQKLSFSIIDNEINSNYQTYEVINLNDEIISLSLVGNTYEISAIQEGIAKIQIKPLIENEIIEDTKEITVNISHKYSDSFSYTVYKGNQELEVKNNKLNAYIFEKYSLVTSISNDATISKIRYTSSNENVATVDNNGDLIFNNIGQTIITIKEEYSNKSLSLELNVYNYIALNKDNPFSLEGHNAKKIDDNHFSITNGISGKVILNFLKESTYTSVTYISSNEEIASISADGTITPYKMGTTTITIVCDDGMQEKIEITFKLTIERQDYIQDLSNFFYKVRKGLGHFSAFLILGIFSSLTWLLFLDGKKLFLSIPLNYISGFLIAALTEIIQLYVPGRHGCMDDVMLDFDGFLIGSSITAIIVLIYLAKRAYDNSLRRR